MEVEQGANIVMERIGKRHMSFGKELPLDGMWNVFPKTFLYFQEKLFVGHSVLALKKFRKSPEKIVANEMIKNKTVLDQSRIIFSSNDMLAKLEMKSFCFSDGGIDRNALKITLDNSPWNKALVQFE